MTLPIELERARKLTHRSPTYGVKLDDGRDLYVRREALAFKQGLSLDLELLAAGGGDVRWYARCGSREVHADTLGNAIVSAIGPRESGDEEYWADIRSVVQVALSIAEQAAPCEVQA